MNVEWYNELKKLTRGMPPLDASPDMELPESDPPQSDEVIVDMDDQRLANAYHIASKWKAYCDYATGVYAAGEVAYAQKLSDMRRVIYMQNYSHKKPANVKEGEMTIDSDPEVIKTSEMYTAMKAGHVYYKNRSSQFGQLAMTYGNERKDRRERELRSWSD